MTKALEEQVAGAQAEGCSSGAPPGSEDTGGTIQDNEEDQVSEACEGLERQYKQLPEPLEPN